MNKRHFSTWNDIVSSDLSISFTNIRKMKKVLGPIFLVMLKFGFLLVMINVFMRITLNYLELVKYLFMSK
jgi:hypothetical protein